MAKRQTTLLLKKSGVPGKIPTELQLGELAINFSDVILYASGTTANQILPIGWDRVSKTGDTMSGTLYTPSISATTISATTYYGLPALTGDYLPLSGGTVYGTTYFTNGLNSNTLNVSGLTQTSGITSTGGITFKQVTINSSYTATTNDYMIDISGGTFTVSLPSAIGIQGRLLVIKNNGGGAVTVDPYNSETIDDKPYVILGETNSILLCSNGSNWVAMSYNISTVNSSTGVFSFTGLTKVSSNTFNVGEVRGWIVNDTTNPLSPQLYYVYYSGGVHTDNYINTANETFVYLTSGGTVQQQSTPLTTTQRRQNIFLGKIGHPDKTTINLVFSQPDYVLSPLAQLRDMFLPINLINGGVYPSPNTGLTFNTNAGYIYGLGINFASDTLNPNSLYVTGTNPCTFQYRTQTGGTITNVTNIDPLNYDVGGVITPITGTKASNQRIFLLQNGTFRVQYGQHTYTNFSEAVQAIQTETFTEFPNFINNAVLIGILTVLSTATDLTDTSKAQFFFASKFGETVGAAGGVSTTNLQQAYNNSTNPEIITNPTLDGVQFRGGTGSDLDANIVIENNSGIAKGRWLANGGLSATTMSSTTLTLNSTTTTTDFFNVYTNTGAKSLVVDINGYVYNRGASGISSNTAFGQNTLTNSGSSSSNTAFGYNALRDNTGANNIAVGTNALIVNITGDSNTAIGVNALRFNTIGDDNIAVGGSALNANVTGSTNVAIGSSVLTSNIASSNTGVGYRVLYSNTSGTANSGLGNSSLRINTTGSYNAGLGQSSLQLNTTGNHNIGIGYLGNYGNTTGSGNIGIGTTALGTSYTGSSNTSIGYESLRFLTNASNLTAVGYQALRATTTGSTLNAFGYRALYSNTIGTNNSAFGTESQTLLVSGSSNTSLGNYSLNKIAGSSSNNVGIGANAGYSSTSTSNSTLIGNNVSFSNITGSSNTIIGASAGYNILTDDNVIIGKSAGFSVTGSSNTIIGANTTLPATTTSSLVLADGNGVVKLSADSSHHLFIPNSPSSGSTSDRILTRSSSGEIKEINTTNVVLKTKSGVVAFTSFTGSPYTYDVVFVTPFTDALYSPQIIGYDSRSWTVSNVTSSGFRIETNSTTILTNNVYWTVTKHGEN